MQTTTQTRDLKNNDDNSTYDCNPQSLCVEEANPRTCSNIKRRTMDNKSATNQ